MPTAQSGNYSAANSPALPAERGGSVNTGVRDVNYNLISVLYHALQGAEAIAHYVKDAEASTDTQLAEFLEEARGSYVELAQQAKELLAARLPTEEAAKARIQEDTFDEEDLG